MSQSKTYSLNIDPVVLAAKIKAAGGPAIDSTQPTGEASAKGVTLGWVIAGQSICVTILSKPWIIGYNTVWDHVDAILGEPL
jgi:hypothetical protein